MTDPYGVFDLAGCHFACYLPMSGSDEQVWTIIVTKDGKEVRRDKVQLLHAPVFGPDVGDVGSLNDRVEEMIKEMGL